MGWGWGWGLGFGFGFGLGFELPWPTSSLLRCDTMCARSTTGRPSASTGWNTVCWKSDRSSRSAEVRQSTSAPSWRLVTAESLATRRKRLCGDKGVRVRGRGSVMRGCAVISGGVVIGLCHAKGLQHAKGATWCMQRGYSMLRGVQRRLTGRSRSPLQTRTAARRCSAAAAPGQGQG